MRLVPAKTHALTDYLIGLLLIVTPFLLDWMGDLTIPLVVAGVVLIGYSALTDYELGLGFIPMRIHLLLDSAVAIVLVFLPVIFRVDAFSPLLLLAGILLALSVTTELEPAEPIPVVKVARVRRAPGDRRG